MHTDLSLGPANASPCSSQILPVQWIFGQVDFAFALPAGSAELTEAIPWMDKISECRKDDQFKGSFRLACHPRE